MDNLSINPGNPGIRVSVFRVIHRVIHRCALGCRRFGCKRAPAPRLCLLDTTRIGVLRCGGSLRSCRAALSPAKPRCRAAYGFPSDRRGGAHPDPPRRYFRAAAARRSKRRAKTPGSKDRARRAAAAWPSKRRANSNLAWGVQNACLAPRVREYVPGVVYAVQPTVCCLTGFLVGAE